MVQFFFVAVEVDSRDKPASKSFSGYTALWRSVCIAHYFIYFIYLLVLP